MDIVGFEHAPSTDEDKQAIAKAEEILTAGASLFALSANARCTLLDADVDHPSLSSKPDRHDHGDNTTIKIKTSTKTVITTRSAQTARMTSIRRLRRITGSGVRISGNSSVSM